MSAQNINVREYILAKTEENIPMLKEVNSIDWDKELIYNEQIAEMLCKLFYMDSLAVERNYVVAFDAKMRIKGVFLAGQGSATKVAISMSEIMKFLLLIGAVQFIDVHNHPDGGVEASEEDNKFTNALQQVSDLLGLMFIGSMIIDKEGYYVYGGLAEQKRKEKEKAEKDKKIKEISDSNSKMLEMLQLLM